MWDDGMPIKYDLDCIVKEVQTGKKVKKLKAREITELEIGSGWIGGQASGSLSYRIATNEAFNAQPYNHAVVIDGVQFIITAKMFLTHTTPGESFTGKKVRELVLALE